MDLYSGRPNPRFPLEPATAGELAHRIGALTPAPASGRPDVGLGYRGLRVLTGPHGTGAGVVVSGGVVTLPGPDGTPRRLRDPGRALERWLLARGVGHLDPAVVATVRRELAR
ncbi:hypothetical protein [Streptomyces sp. CBMA156]|uniref:hypothetical protein n=1 Tax=Streptomyces sp. CBMA156 TaxID=1930280 RepID=UPI001661C532|nr:hypothetical protein [Streptomyces sp. CBMA156]MBD0669340.1 hypothetical protein [Streptomyces sp. CBMA156]